MPRRFVRRREALVEELAEKGIADQRVLEAIRLVPRHQFVDEALIGRAYEDEALPIGLGQTISQPYTVAHQTMLLSPQPGERILEIGTGSGYQAAVLVSMGVQVFSVERHRPLYERTRQLLRQIGYRVTCRFGDGMEGWDAMAPFDGIVVTAGARSVPPALLYQLREPEEEGARGGRLIIPVGGSGGQTMWRYWRTGAESFEREETQGFRFVPLLPNTEG